jgi:hypothetical protein
MIHRPQLHPIVGAAGRHASEIATANRRSPQRWRPKVWDRTADMEHNVGAGIPPGNPMRRTSMPLPTNRGKAV